MYKKLRKLLYLMTILAVLLMSAMPSYAVYADGGTEGEPPPEDPVVTAPTETSVEDSEATTTEDGYYFQATTEETGVFVLAVFEIES